MAALKRRIAHRTVQMTISSISPGSQPGIARSTLKQAGQDFSNLAGSLQSGDMSGASSAYSDLMKLMQGLQQGAPAQPSGSASPAPASVSQPQAVSSPLQATGPQGLFNSDLNSVGTALQSGDVGSAQQAFQKLLQDLQSAYHGHHHHHHERAASAEGAAAAWPATPPASAGINATA